MWNAIPRGYYVYLFLYPSNDPSNVFTILYPDSSFLEVLPPGRYGITVVAVNAVNRTEILTMETTVDDTDGSFADYPYFYILIPGILFVVVIVVIIIVIFKKLCERNKGSVGFVRGEGREGRGEGGREKEVCEV